MYLNIDGYNKIADRIKGDRQLELENQRRATQDARAAEAFDRQKKQWGLEDALQAEVANQAEQLGGLASAKGYDWRTGLGVPAESPAAAPADAATAGGLSTPTNRAAIDQYVPPAPATAADGLSSGAKPGRAQAPAPTSSPLDDELDGIKRQAELARASRDPAMLAKAQAAYFDHKKRRTAAEMTAYFDSASPDELSRLASSITADQTNKVKAVYDKNTGFTRLETDDGVQTLRPAELKKYLIARAVNNIDGMAAAQASHTARVDKDNAIAEKVTTINNQGEYRSGLIDAKQAALDAKAAAGQAGQPTREERLRYTSLFTDAGRRLAEAQKSLTSLQRDPMWARASTKPGTPQAEELQRLRDTIKMHSEERTLYQSMLAGSQTSGGTGPKPAGRTQGPGEAGMREAVSGEMGADPQAIQREIQATQKSLSVVTDSGSKEQLQAYLNDLQQQANAIGSESAASAPAAAKRPAKSTDYSHLWKK